MVVINRKDFTYVNLPFRFTTNETSLNEEILLLILQDGLLVTLFTNILTRKNFEYFLQKIRKYNETTIGFLQGKVLFSFHVYLQGAVLSMSVSVCLRNKKINYKTICL